MDYFRKQALKKLASHLCWEWCSCEYGAPAVDPKRPYGNSSVEVDILEILEIKPEGDDGNSECYSSEQREFARQLHSDMLPYLEQLTKGK